MPDPGDILTMISGVPVLAMPAEIDITMKDQLNAVLLEAASGTHPVIVVDMTGTQFCDSAAIHAVLLARLRIVAEGRELRLVMPPDSAVYRMASLTGIDSVIACFPSLEAALTQLPAVAIPLPAPPHDGEDQA